MLDLRNPFVVSGACVWWLTSVMLSYIDCQVSDNIKPYPITIFCTETSSAAYTRSCHGSKQEQELSGSGFILFAKNISRWGSRWQKSWLAGLGTMALWTWGTSEVLRSILIFQLYFLKSFSKLALNINWILEVLDCQSWWQESFPALKFNRFTCVASSGVFNGGTEGRFLLRPRVTASYSLETLLALM